MKKRDVVIASATSILPQMIVSMAAFAMTQWNGINNI